MSDDYIDDQLRDGLGPPTSDALSEWCAFHDRHYWLERWLVNGRSRAPVAVVGEADAHEERARKLVLKVPRVDDGQFARIEYARHRLAVKQSPAFAAKHLSEVVYEPIRVGDDSFVTFQKIAGKTFEDMEVLTVLLRRMLKVRGSDEDPDGVEAIACDPRVFASACGRLVAGVLREWAVKPQVPERTPPLTVAGFLALHLADQLQPGGRLHPYASRYQGAQIQVEGEERSLPNPFALAEDRYFTDPGTIKPLLGKCHGDLHTDNTLIRVRPAVDVTDFFLIDNALYEERGPLTRDPVHLVLYIIARTMETISAHQQDALIDALIDPRGTDGLLLPGWLWLIVSGVDAECTAWIEEESLTREWRAQTLLSLVACALLFIGRTSTREIDKPWFLRLAGRAAARYEAMHPALRRQSAATGAEPDARAQPTAWISRLCHDFPDIATAAAAASQDPVLDELRTAALGGLDRAEEFRTFIRAIGGPDHDPRYGTRGAEGQPLDGETYTCPLELCDRRDRREPGGPLPQCRLPRTGPRTLTLDLG